MQTPNETAFKTADRTKKDQQFQITLERLNNIDNDLKVFFTESLVTYNQTDIATVKQRILQVKHEVLNVDTSLTEAESYLKSDVGKEYYKSLVNDTEQGILTDMEMQKRGKDIVVSIIGKMRALPVTDSDLKDRLRQYLDYWNGQLKQSDTNLTAMQKFLQKLKKERITISADEHWNGTIKALNQRRLDLVNHLEELEIYIITEKKAFKEFFGLDYDTQVFGKSSVGSEAKKKKPRVKKPKDE